MCENTEDYLKWWQPDMMDNLLFKEKPSRKSNEFLDTDSGIYGTDSLTTHYECPTPCKQTPVILINEDQIVDNIEMAQIESYYQRISTPEGNVKYKNYKTVAGAPIRMYTPSGDIHTTPKKGKIVPKYELFEDSLMPRDRILSLINPESFGAKELEAIIRTTSSRRRAIEILRSSNISSLDDKIDYLNSLLYTPSPSAMSIMSDDSVFTDRFLTPSPTPEPSVSGYFRSHSIDIDDSVLDRKRKNFNTRQISVPCTDEPAGQMSLQDELKFADNRHPRSLTPRKMTAFEYSFFHRPFSSMSANKNVRQMKSERVKGESKKMIIRNFIQRNMIDRTSNMEKLAKLALAIEEDCDEEEGHGKITTSARQMDEKLDLMLDETKEWKNEIIEIQENMQVI